MNEKKSFLEKYAELIKWFISNVVIIVVTIIIDNGFKKRSAGIQEMQAFDKYVEIILKADNIEERWKLSEFFSTVTPTNRLREKWISYKKLISTDYEKFKDLKDKEFALSEEVKQGKSVDAIKKLNKVKKQLEPYEQKLADLISFKMPEPIIDKKYSASDDNNSVYKNPQLQDSKELDNRLKAFKEEIQKSAGNDMRYKIDDVFNKSRDINNSVVQQLGKELGDPYETIQTGVSSNYKESTYSNQYGIQSKFDNTKRIWPVLLVKVADSDVIITITEKGSTETLKLPINNIDWEKMRLFIRNFFIKRLNQLL